ncbi:DNA-binding transcriptional MerR regulator [Halopolyspora algeriensis]|uniref:DNA-binding transcriptional MerR regulator n=1 Tax=Halopolyspora algeriensis TaxID=1500506 RepID=A0A368VP71_9ACTN|nr:MerR family transcriptional regulator [Halopolyspora algeriensis]RCW43318.1 DNA-binding transcriptional MerR regulator [Halopolyspora algeriensis]TQM56376.1 DNA-binding transcriptional MerR regulator [Halopolyspora algeriensis]
MSERYPTDRAQEAFDDADYPAYTMGRAADMLGVTPDFLRSLGPAGLLDPNRSHGGHRRYSRSELVLAARVRELLDEEGMSLLVAVCRLARLESELHDTRQRLRQLEDRARQNGADRPRG